MVEIIVAGIGPGHPDYILPIVSKTIQNADLVMGYSRALESVNELNENTWNITTLDSAMKKIREWEEGTIVLVVSGDTGFYSMLTWLKNVFTTIPVKALPGISSLQYLFARLGLVWQDAALLSLHGRESEWLEKVRNLDVVGLLTDKQHTPQWIANELIIANLSDRVITIGENLSYENEKITTFIPEELSKLEESFSMNVVLVQRSSKNVS